MAKKKYIETPEKMWQLFTEYKDHIKSHPILKKDFKGKDADTVIYELERPLTMEGFENYVADKDIIQSLDQYFTNQEGNYEEYLGICSRIKRVIRQDQIEGGMVNIYNPSITQRLNNLVDRQDHTSKDKEIKSIPLVLQDGRTYEDLKEELKPE